jgi:diacylglycerol kinase (ATP)
VVEPLLRALEAAGASSPVAHALTGKAGDEGRLAAEALARGFRKVVAVGGDGTWSHVASALLQADTDAALGLVPGGTGCDLAKSLGIPGDDLGGCAQIILGGRTRRIDVGRVESRTFLNVAGFGYDVAVIEDSWRVRWLSGSLLYLYCAMRQLFRFPGFPVELARNGEEPQRREMLMLILANGRVFGGGFQIAPQAGVDDGLLDCVAFGNMPARRRLPLLVRLLRGTHAAAPEVQVTSGRAFRLRFAESPAYETDGEWNRAQTAELTVDLLPGALRVLVP